MARWVLTLHGHLPLPNEIYAMTLRERIRAKTQWRNHTWWAVVAAGIPRLDAAHVTFTRYSAGRPDADAIPAAFKPVADGLTDLTKGGTVILRGILPDDSPQHLQATYRAASCRRGEARIEVAIDGVEAEGAA